jgi:hypothetical protein
MKKFNGSILALFVMLLNTATTYSWKWLSWAQYGIQQGKAALLGIKNHPKTTGAVVAIGIGGLALAYKYQDKLRSLWVGSYRLQQEQIIADIAEYWDLRQNKKKNSTEQQRCSDLSDSLLKIYQSYLDSVVMRYWPIKRYI